MPSSVQFKEIRSIFLSNWYEIYTALDATMTDQEMYVAGMTLLVSASIREEPNRADELLEGWRGLIVDLETNPSVTSWTNGQIRANISHRIKGYVDAVIERQSKQI